MRLNRDGRVDMSNKCGGTLLIQIRGAKACLLRSSRQSLIPVSHNEGYCLLSSLIGQLSLKQLQKAYCRLLLCAKILS